MLFRLLHPRDLCSRWEHGRVGWRSFGGREGGEGDDVFWDRVGVCGLNGGHDEIGR